MKFLLKLFLILILCIVAASGVFIYQNGVQKFKKHLQHLAFEIGNSLVGKKTNTPAPQAVAKATSAPAENVQMLTTIIPPKQPAGTPQNKAMPSEDPNRASILASLQSSRAEWPLRVTNKIPIQVPLVANGHVIGQMPAPAGSPLAIVAVNGETVTVNYRGGTKEMAVSDTDLIQRVEELRKIHGSSAASTPAPLSAPRPSPSSNGLDSTAPGVNSSTHYFGVPAGK